MEYSREKKVKTDDYDLVFSDICFCKKDGCISIEIKAVKIDIIFINDDSGKTETKTEVPDNKTLKITCKNYDATIPDEQGLFERKKVFAVGAVNYYLQLFSSIYSTQSGIRRTTIIMTKDPE